jgi:hypothetical protein
MASKKRSGCIKALIVSSIISFVFLVSVVALFLLLPWSCEVGELDWDLWRTFEPLMFMLDYAGHASSDEVAKADLEKWYAPNAVKPDLERVDDSLSFLVDQDITIPNWFFRNVVISLNMGHDLSTLDSLEVLDIWQRISAPGEDPVFLMPLSLTGEEEDPDGGQINIEFRHNPSLEEDELHLVFELWGKDPDSGALKRERHRVTFVEKPEHDEEEPEFLVVSHVVEPLPPEPAETPDE